MSSVWGNNIQISIFGESHGPAIGVTVHGLPAGEKIDWDEILFQMERRRPGQDPAATRRKETDTPEVLSGLLDGTLTGAPLTAIIRNGDQHSGDYSNLLAMPRPGHADYTASVRYNDANDIRGGGHFSGRLTAALTFAGAVCRQILRGNGIAVGAHIASVGDVQDAPFDPVAVTAEQLEAMGEKKFPVVDPAAEEKMRAVIEAARMEGDSVGGVVECALTGVMAGIGSPMFEGVENRIASIVFGIPAVKGVEFGAGFGATRLRGSENNDPFLLDAEGEVRTATNHAGGILGGITTGMPILFRAAFKPTSSISRPQRTLNVHTGEMDTLVVHGRHDPCIVLRAVPVVEAAAAIAMLDMLM